MIFANCTRVALGRSNSNSSLPGSQGSDVHARVARIMAAVPRCSGRGARPARRLELIRLPVLSLLGPDVELLRIPLIGTGGSGDGAVGRLAH